MNPFIPQVVITPEESPFWLSSEDVLAKGVPEGEVENYKWVLSACGEERGWKGSNVTAYVLVRISSVWRERTRGLGWGSQEAHVLALAFLC